MSRLLACRICLSYDVLMYSILNSYLHETYEKLSLTALQTNDMRPVTVCYICFHHLKKMKKFIDLVQRADQLLGQMVVSGVEITQKSIDLIDKTSYNISQSLNICSVLNLSNVPLEIKVEGPEDCKIIKNEEGLNVIEPVNDTPDEEHSSDDAPAAPIDDDTDSEDDIPLQSISKKKIRRSKKRLKVDKKDVSLGVNTTAVKPDAREIKLTREEQLQHLLERSKSFNYIHSPYKCQLCFKGFADPRTYGNHKQKHDKRNGDFECEICHMRYVTPRQLRTHTATSHSRQFACNKCDHRSHTANQAQVHEKWHNGFLYECQLCGHKFRKPTSYLSHMRKSHPTEHICNICGECFVGRHGLLMHKKKGHKAVDEDRTQSDTTKFCSECNIHFVSLEAWCKHVLSSLKHNLSNDGRTTCLVCGVELPSSALKRHLLAHEDIIRPAADIKPAKKSLDKVPCEMCGTVFANHIQLQAHIKRMHLGLKYDKNIVCEVCGKKWKSNALLKYHQRTHTGERPHECSVCGKRFSTQHQRRVHGRIHSGERPYSCDTCGRRFSQKAALNRHSRVHTGAKPYSCQFCAKTFSQSNSVKLHIKTVHLKLPREKKKLDDVKLETDKTAIETPVL